MAEQDRETIDEMLEEARKDLGNEEAAPSKQQARNSKLHRLVHWCHGHKVLSGLLSVVSLLVLLTIIPFTRHKAAGLFISRDVTMYVVDSQTNQAVSGAEVWLQGKVAKTDGSGKAEFHALKPGRNQAKVQKKYYQDSLATVTIGIRPVTYGQTIEAVAMGRQVPLRVTNKITGKGLAGVNIQVGGTEAQTDVNGEATVVVDSSATTLEGNLTAEQYIPVRINVTVTSEVTANSFAMTPVGKVYFLSKKTGSIDVVKTNLDGTERVVVLAGTGNEETSNTALLASNDWQFFALMARREGSHAMLYFIDGTDEDKRTEIDSENAMFTLVGWSGHTLVYLSENNTLPAWSAGRTQLKAFNADTGAITTIDQTAATGSSLDNYMSESFSKVFLASDRIVYAKNWTGTHKDIAKKQASLYAAHVSSTENKPAVSFENSRVTLIKVRPSQFYLQQTDLTTAVNKFYIYEPQKDRMDSSLTEEKFMEYHPLYSVSPDGRRSLWSQPTGGSTTLFIGDGAGDQGRKIASGSYQVYGWYGDEYVLVSRNGSELYIAPARESNIDLFQKVADYHNPALSFEGYGAY